jgi:hypothetical protein
MCLCATGDEGDDGENGEGVHTTRWEIQNNLLNTAAAERENETENETKKWEKVPSHWQGRDSPRAQLA